MSVGSRDSYLKSLPAVGPFLDRVARYRMKGFHREERNGDGNELDVVATYPVFPPWSPGVPKWTRDATANDSDKSFTVPAGKAWVLKHVEGLLINTATVGNRFLRIAITTAAGDELFSLDTAAVAASQLGQCMLYDGAALTATPYRTHSINNYNVMQVAPLPHDTILPAGTIVRVWDVSAIDPAADDLTVILHYVEYDA